MTVKLACTAALAPVTGAWLLKRTALQYLLILGPTLTRRCAQSTYLSDVLAPGNVLQPQTNVKTAEQEIVDEA